MDPLEQFRTMDKMQRAGVKIRINCAILALVGDYSAQPEQAHTVASRIVDDAIAAEMRGDPLPTDPTKAG